LADDHGGTSAELAPVHERRTRLANTDGTLSGPAAISEPGRWRRRRRRRRQTLVNTDGTLSGPAAIYEPGRRRRTVVVTRPPIMSCSDLVPAADPEE